MDTDRVIERLFKIQSKLFNENLKVKDKCKDIDKYSLQELELIKEHTEFIQEIQMEMINLYVSLGALDDVTHIKVEDL